MRRPGTRHRRVGVVGISALGLLMVTGCASARRDHHLAERQQLEERIAALALETERLQAQVDSLTAQLQRLKEIDLKTRTRVPRIY
jgi:outer membrane murein-binding lipoprotein Lpp